MTSSYCSALVAWSFAWMVKLCRAVLIVPFAALVVALPSTPRTASSVSPRVCNFAGSACPPPVFECHPARLQLRRIALHADGGLLLAADDDLRDAGDLRDLLRHDIV